MVSFPSTVITLSNCIQNGARTHFAAETAVMQFRILFVPPLSGGMEIEMAERKKKTFESSLARLEEIVRAMESGDIMLDESLSLYEEGIKLIKFCTKALDDAEQKVKILQKGEEGSLVEVDFTRPEETAQ